MGYQNEIQKQKELLYLNALKVANNILEEAALESMEVSSGLLSASASLLKLKMEEVVDSSNNRNDIQRLLSSLVAGDKTTPTKNPSIHYKKS